MSNPWTTFDPEDAERIMKRIERLLTLRKEIGGMSFSHFSICDIDALTRVMGSDIKKPAREEDITYLEKRLLAIKNISSQ